jgi:superfamily II DNA or RNA helicase
MSFKNIPFPSDLEYSSDTDRIPLEFYLEIIPKSKTIYLKLGYFSSKAIQTLSFGFAQFIHNGGNIKIVTNHYLYENDTSLLDTEKNIDDLDKNFLKDLDWLYSNLSEKGQYFINCLKLLSRLERLEIIPVMLRPRRMTHYKQGIFIDHVGNEVCMDGSCNFTGKGLLENGESLNVYRSWGGSLERIKTASRKEDITKLVEKEHSKYIYLNKNQIGDMIQELGEDKTVSQLLEDEAELVEDDLSKKASQLLTKHKNLIERDVEKFNSTPRFPYAEGPRGYQNKAYQNWVASGKTGIFAMATGTGKTITSLNCLLREQQIDNYYHAIIIVPTKALLKQWIEEVKHFNFTKVYPASSEFKWKEGIEQLNTSLMFDNNESFVVITTYDTFSSDTFQKKIRAFPSSTILIADEAHNIGSDRMKSVLPKLPFKRKIALSATPKRRFDEEGNQAIEEYFHSREPYTYSFSMEKAIKEKILCDYRYYPQIVYLTETEMDKYRDISHKLIKLYDQNKQAFRNPEAAKILLLERRRVIHKAVNKLEKFQEVVQTIVNKRGKLDYTFVYVPEGDDEHGDNLLDIYMDWLDKSYPDIKLHHFTSSTDNRDLIMENFKDGYIDTLFSMKCLDEGVDVPRAEVAIFCSSTGNPRQFIQRRGRVLRKHPDKEMAYIYDLIVVPVPSYDSVSQVLEQNLLKEELVRVIYFASMARNYYDALGKVQEVSALFNIDVYALEEDLRDQNER